MLELTIKQKVELEALVQDVLTTNQETLKKQIYDLCKPLFNIHHLSYAKFLEMDMIHIGFEFVNILEI